MKVLYLMTNRKPVVIEFEENLESMQTLVGGNIEEVLIDENVALVCNETGKLDGLPINRALHNSTGKIVDFIVGDFFICSAPEESEVYQDLSDEQIEKYSKLFAICG